jgi:hypothetical protein
MPIKIIQTNEINRILIKITRIKYINCTRYIRYFSTPNGIEKESHTMMN